MECQTVYLPLHVWLVERGHGTPAYDIQSPRPERPANKKKHYKGWDPHWRLRNNIEHDTNSVIDKELERPWTMHLYTKQGAFHIYQAVWAQTWVNNTEKWREILEGSKNSLADRKCLGGFSVNRRGCYTRRHLSNLWLQHVNSIKKKT